MMCFRLRSLTATIAVVAALIAAPAVTRAETVRVFAAASTTDALNEVIGAYTKAGGETVLASYASSSTLAKQVEQGAPADVFVSANPKWMDYLEKAGLLKDGSRADLLGNALVLVAPKDSTVAPTLEKGFPLADLLGDGRLSVGDPDHVPAGIYAKTALTTFGVWAVAEPKLARASDVRGALALVERGEAPLGIVYSTDAAITDGVRIAATFPEDSHDPITYPVALTKEAGPDAAGFLDFLKTDEAKAIFERYGFVVKN